MATFEGGTGDDKLIKTNADTVVGKAGHDTLSAGVMIGESGSDTYYVNSASDIVVEIAGEESDTVYSTVTSYTLPANVENLTLNTVGTLFPIGIQPIGGTGNELGNIIHGNQYRNGLSGQGGNDFLSSGLGNDTLHGGAGEDTLIGTNLNLGFGKGEIDVMFGGSQKDTFFLGSSSADRVLYDDGNANQSGAGDYARIKDLEIGVDKVQLYGFASDYILESSFSLGITGTSIVVKGTSYSSAELIGVLEGISPDQISLNSSTFQYVQ